MVLLFIDIGISYQISETKGPSSLKEYLVSGSCLHRFLNIDISLFMQATHSCWGSDDDLTLGQPLGEWALWCEWFNALPFSHNFIEVTQLCLWYLVHHQMLIQKDFIFFYQFVCDCQSSFSDCLFHLYWRPDIWWRVLDTTIHHFKYSIWITVLKNTTLGFLGTP